MAGRRRSPSPILGTAAAMIGAASDSLIGRDSRFRHSFEVPVEAVRPEPGQARKVFDDGEIRALAATMAEHGQLQPILLRPDPEARGRWIIVAGERRWRAAMVNGWTSVLAIEHDGDPEVASLVENLQRVDLTPVEEARGLQRLIRDKGWTQAAAAAALGRSKAEVSALLRILTLPEEVQEAVLTSELDIPKNALVELARVEPAAARNRLIELARAGALTIKAIRAAGKVRARDGPPPGRAGTPRLGAKAIERVTEGLRAARAAGRPLDEAGRERLMRLKQEIEAYLARD